MPPNSWDIFRQDMLEAGIMVEDCPEQGPEGWMVLRARAWDEQELRAIQEATTVRLDWESPGKSGYLVYPA